MERDVDACMKCSDNFRVFIQRKKCENLYEPIYISVTGVIFKYLNDASDLNLTVMHFGSQIIAI